MPHNRWAGDQEWAGLGRLGGCRSSKGYLLQSTESGGFLEEVTSEIRGKGKAWHLSACAFGLCGKSRGRVLRADEGGEAKQVVGPSLMDLQCHTQGLKLYSKAVRNHGRVSSRGETGSDVSIRNILLGPCGDALVCEMVVARTETGR